MSAAAKPPPTAPPAPAPATLPTVGPTPRASAAARLQPRSAAAGSVACRPARPARWPKTRGQQPWPWPRSQSQRGPPTVEAARCHAKKPDALVARWRSYRPGSAVRRAPAWVRWARRVRSARTAQSLHWVRSELAESSRRTQQLVLQPMQQRALHRGQATVGQHSRAHAGNGIVQALNLAGARQRQGQRLHLHVDGED